MVEHLAVNQEVVGSSPTTRANIGEVMKGLCSECETFHKRNEPCFDDKWGFKKSTLIRKERDAEFVDMHRKLNETKTEAHS